MDINMVPLGTEVNQVLQTKHALYDAFTQLLDSRAYNDITVGQICKKANFSRAVFYNHYHNKNEFLQEIFNRIIALYHKKIDHAERKGTLTEEFIHTTFLGILQEYKKFFLLLDDIRRLDMLEHFLEQENYSIFCRAAHLEAAASTTCYCTYLLRYHAIGLSGLYIDWLRRDNPIPVEDFVKILKHLLQYQTIKSFVTFMEEL